MIRRRLVETIVTIILLVNICDFIIFTQNLQNVNHFISGYFVQIKSFQSLVIKYKIKWLFVESWNINLLYEPV